MPNTCQVENTVILSDHNRIPLRKAQTADRQKPNLQTADRQKPNLEKTQQGGLLLHGPRQHIPGAPSIALATGLKCGHELPRGQDFRRESV